MFWILRKIFGLGVLAALIFLALHYQVGGKPIQEYVVQFYQSPLIQEAVRQGRDTALSYLHKDIRSSVPSADAPPDDKLSDQDREELEKILKKVK